MLPHRQEARQCVGGDRLDLLAQRGERAPAQRCAGPRRRTTRCRRRPAGTRPATTRPVAASRSQRLLRQRGAEPEPLGDGVDVERRRGCGRSGRPGRPSGSRTGSRNASGTPTGSGGAERVAQAAGVLDGGPALLAGDAHPDRPPGRFQLGQPAGLRAALDRLGVCVSGPRRRSRSATPSASRARRSSVSRCRSRSSGEHRVGVEQLAQLGLAEQLGEQRGVERERLRPGARRAASRPRTGTGRRSRTAATGRTATAAASRPRRGAPGAPRRRASARPGPARRTRPAGTRASPRARSGTSRTRWRPRAAGRTAGVAATAACGVPGSRRGSSRARAAHSRNREANSADPPTSSVTSGSISSGRRRRRRPTAAATRR